ncbi:hypothetical protein MPTK2_2g17630 [Marchantia polymorpha subsp. ruderalis]
MTKLVRSLDRLYTSVPGVFRLGASGASFPAVPFGVVQQVAADWNSLCNHLSFDVSICSSIFSEYCKFVDVSKCFESGYQDAGA